MAESEDEYITVAVCWKNDELDTTPLASLLNSGYEIVRVDCLPGCSGMRYAGALYDRRIPSALVYILRKRN